MANMSTHVQRSWDGLREESRGASIACVSGFREWMLSDLLNVSRLVQPRLEKAQANPVWHQLLTSPIRQFAVRKTAWREFAGSLGPKPPTFNPEALWDWAESSLWKLLVFIDPEEACDNDQGDLELWWSPSIQRAALVCEFGENFVFRRRTTQARWTRTRREPLESWIAATEDLAPASTDVVSRLYSDVELLA